MKIRPVGTDLFAFWPDEADSSFSQLCEKAYKLRMTYICYWNWKCERDGATCQCAVCETTATACSSATCHNCSIAYQGELYLRVAVAQALWTSVVIPGLAAVIGVQWIYWFLVKRRGTWSCTCCRYQDLAFLYLLLNLCFSWDVEIWD